MYSSKKLFIINPIAGGRSKHNLPDLIKGAINDANFDIVFTESSEHATELTNEGIKNGFTDFIAVGGDGTINEIAKSLIGTDFNLAILPLGSGNGLARHNKIPMDLKLALTLLNNPTIQRIDTCMLNDMPFINMSGVGFDAHIGKLFAENKHNKRGFSSYINTTLNEFINYKAQKYIIKADGKLLEEEAFLVSFANSSQYGNNAFIAPKASMTDGMVDICIMKPFPPVNIISLGFRLFNKSLNDSAYFKTIKAREIELIRDKSGEIHVDGEPFETGTNISVMVLPKSLNLIVPHLN
jgi:diacylglycerol kinase (ATP)